MTHVEPEVRNAFRNKPCPICESIEGCDHPLIERLRASFDTDYRDQLRAEDPLWQLQQAKRAARVAANPL